MKKLVKQPVKPKKTVTVRNSVHFPFYNYGGDDKAPMLSFLDWCKETIPQGATNVVIGIDSEFDDFNGYLSSSHIELSWDQEIENAFYDKDMKKYEKKLAKWKEQNVKS